MLETFIMFIFGFLLFVYSFACFYQDGPVAGIVMLLITALCFAFAIGRLCTTQKTETQSTQNSNNEANTQHKTQSRTLSETEKLLSETAYIAKQTRSYELAYVLSHIIQTTLAIEKNKTLEKLSQSDTSQITNYYLPLAVKLAKTHITLENNGIEFEGENQMQQKIINSLCEINNALIKMNENIFDALELDLDTDMEVLETIIAKDGLNKDDF